MAIHRVMPIIQSEAAQESLEFYGLLGFEHPLQDEEWGVRRFFVRDPNGRVVNVLNHRSA